MNETKEDSLPRLVGLVWKKRVPKYKRAIAMKALRKCYPDAEDNGVSVRFTARDTGYIMIFMLSKVFSEFEPNVKAQGIEAPQQP